MATSAHTIPGGAGRRTPFAAAVMTADLRAAISREATQLLDAATFLLDFLNAADAPAEDMEPDHDGEAETVEGWLQPVTLAPPVRPVVTIRPTRAQMRAAYRRIGAPVPAELRGLIGRAFA